jgi:dihydrofolate reductase
MRKLFLFMMVSLDGYFEGRHHDISWHNVDQEFNDFAVKQLDEVDTLIFGARTYRLMADFWPTDTAIKADPHTATRMNALKKHVFSRTLKEAGWHNTELHTDAATTIQAIKQQSGKDIAVLGSSNLCISLINEGLLDELRIMVNPVILGSGTSLFAGLSAPLKLQLTNERKFASGNVLLTYSAT